MMRATSRFEVLDALSRCLPGGWGRVLVEMGQDFSVQEWSEMSGLDEEVIEWVLSEVRASRHVAG